MEGAPPVANQIDLFMHYLGASRDGLVARPVKMEKLSSSVPHPMGGLLTSWYLVCKVAIQCAIQHPPEEFHVATTSEFCTNDVITPLPISKPWQLSDGDALPHPTVVGIWYLPHQQFTHLHLWEGRTPCIHYLVHKVAIHRPSGV